MISKAKFGQIKPTKKNGVYVYRWNHFSNTSVETMLGMSFVSSTVQQCTCLKCCISLSNPCGDHLKMVSAPQGLGSSFSARTLHPSSVHPRVYFIVTCLFSASCLLVHVSRIIQSCLSLTFNTILLFARLDNILPFLLSASSAFPFCPSTLCWYVTFPRLNITFHRRFCCIQRQMPYHSLLFLYCFLSPDLRSSSRPRAEHTFLVRPSCGGEEGTAQKHFRAHVLGCLDEIIPTHFCQIFQTIY